MTMIPINDVDLYYETAGDGAPLLMIAGLSSDSQSWMPVVPHLSPHYQLIMPDNRAVGRTEPADAETSIEQMAEDCAALLDALGLDRVRVLGHSMGGIVGMHMAAQWPDRVDRLVIAASGPAHSARRVSLIDTLVALGEAGTSDDLWFRSLFHWLFAPPFFDDPAVLDNAVKLSATYPYRQSIAAMRRQADAIARYDARDIAGRIKAPTLAVLGGKDLLFPPEEGSQALQSIGNIQIEILPDAAHSLHWDDPKGFSERLLAFLDAR